MVTDFYKTYCTDHIIWLIENMIFLVFLTNFHKNFFGIYERGFFLKSKDSRCLIEEASFILTAFSIFQ